MTTVLNMKQPFSFDYNASSRSFRSIGADFRTNDERIIDHTKESSKRNSPKSVIDWDGNNSPPPLYPLPRLRRQASILLSNPKPKSQIAKAGLRRARSLPNKSTNTSVSRRNYQQHKRRLPLFWFRPMESDSFHSGSSFKRWRRSSTSSTSNGEGLLETVHGELYEGRLPLPSMRIREWMDAVQIEEWCRSTPRVQTVKANDRVFIPIDTEPLGAEPLDAEVDDDLHGLSFLDDEQEIP